MRYFVFTLLFLGTSLSCIAFANADIGAWPDASITDVAVLVDTGATLPAVTVVLQPLPTVDANDPGMILKYVGQAVKESRWAWLVALALMLLTFLFNKLLKERIPKKVLPWVAISLGVATNMALSFASGMYWLEAIGNGVTLGLAAAGGWSAVGKTLFSAKQQEVIVEEITDSTEDELTQKD